MRQRLLAVGNPPFFQHQVAQATEASANQVDWVEDLDDARIRVAEARGDIETVVISSMVDEQDALELAIDVNETFPTTAVVLVREQAMNGSLPTAMRAGVRDVVDMSRGEAELEQALQRAATWAKSLRTAGPRRPAELVAMNGPVVSVFSSKGGAGKTFVASNLAVAIAERYGREIALIDLDVAMGDTLSYFGKEPTRRLHDLLALGESAERSAIRSCATELHKNVLGFASPADPGASELDSNEIGQVIAMVRTTFPFVVVDVPARYSDHALAALDRSDQVCLVTGLDVVGVRHLSKALDTLVEIGVPRDRLRIVLNRADSKVGIEPSDVERVLGLTVQSRIPSSRLVPTSLNKGVPVYASDPRSDVAKSIGKLADALIADVGQKEEEPQKSSTKRRKFRRS